MILVATVKKNTSLYRQLIINDNENYITNGMVLGGISGEFHRINDSFICIDPAADYVAMTKMNEIEVASFETVPEEWAKLLFIGFKWPVFA